MKRAGQVRLRTYAAAEEIAAIVRLLKRNRGLTAAEAAKVLYWNDGFIGAAVSRLEQQGGEITRHKGARKRRHRVHAYRWFTGRKDRIDQGPNSQARPARRLQTAGDGARTRGSHGAHRG